MIMRWWCPRRVAVTGSSVGRSSRPHPAPAVRQLHGDIGPLRLAHGPLPFRVQDLHDGGADIAPLFRLRPDAGQLLVFLRFFQQRVGSQRQIGPFHPYPPASVCLPARKTMPESPGFLKNG